VTTLARLLAQKQNLLERLLQDPGPHERDEIERLLAEIDDTLNRLDETGPGGSRNA
jgi:Mg2+ and Co2+ transporter CorA